MDAELARRAAHADALVGWRLADARAHAERGDLPAARERLGELRGALGQKLREARVSFYRGAFSHYRADGLDPAVHDMGLQPTPEGADVVRTAQIFGRDIGNDIDDLVEDTSAALTSAALAATNERTPAVGRAAVMGAWETAHRGRLVGLAKRELSDSQMAIHEAVGRMFVLPNLR
jgi:hypothetical protein